MDPRTRRYWESGPKFRPGRRVIDVKRKCPRVSDGETEVQKQVTSEPITTESTA